MIDKDLAIIDESGSLTIAIPEHMRQYQDQVSEAEDLISGFSSLPKLSLKGKQFRYINATGVEVKLRIGEPIDVVILASDPPSADLAKAWYSSAYKPDSDEAPNCSSSNGIYPDPFITEPMHYRCTDCPKNAFGTGSDANGAPSKGKACSDTKILFLLHADTLDGPMVALRAPVTSLKALTVYGKRLVSNTMPMSGVVTRLSFADTEWPQLEFKASRWLNVDETKIAMARKVSKELQDALPSKNQAADKPRHKLNTEAPLRLDGQRPPPFRRPSAEKIDRRQGPDVIVTMTELAGNVPYEKFIEKGWTDELLIAKNYIIVTEGA